jgi:hypothetical protein
MLTSSLKGPGSESSLAPPVTNFSTQSGFAEFFEQNCLFTPMSVKQVATLASTKSPTVSTTMGDATRSIVPSSSPSELTGDSRTIFVSDNRMEIALIKTTLKTKPSHQVINNKKTEKPKNPQENGENQNSPHNNWSLHDHLPREIRNIVPETSTQNVPALPQNSSPLVRQHRSNSCNKNHSHKNNQKHQIEE